MMPKRSYDDKLIRLVQIFSAKLVLEVFGGAGAIWGFSEAIGLRTQDTVWFWRPCALTFGVIFFARWLSQIQDYVIEEDIKFFTGAKTENGYSYDEKEILLAPENKKVYT